MIRSIPLIACSSDRTSVRHSRLWVGRVLAHREQPGGNRLPPNRRGADFLDGKVLRRPAVSPQRRTAVPCSRFSASSRAARLTASPYTV